MTKLTKEDFLRGCELLKGCEHDGSYIPVNEVKRLMGDYAQQFISDEDKEVVSGMNDMLLKDNKTMRCAGNLLAEAAIGVVNNYDGIHRLALAVSDWMTAVANEGDRDGYIKKNKSLLPSEFLKSDVPDDLRNQFIDNMIKWDESLRGLPISDWPTYDEDVLFAMLNNE